jgi:TolB protein
MQDTETTSPNPSVSPADKKSNISPLWLWLIPIVGICTLLVCLAGSGGLAFWQIRGSVLRGDESVVEESSEVTPEAEVTEEETLPSQPEDQGDEAVEEVSPTPQPAEDEELAAIATATATSTSTASSIPSPTETDASTATPAAVSSPAPLPDFCRSAEPSAQPTLAEPLFSSISFAAGPDARGWPLSPTVQFTTTLTRVQAFASYAGMEDGLAWERAWFFGDRELTRGQGVWDAGPRGQLTLQVEAGEGGFVPGRYTLELYIEDKLLSKGSFLMTEPTTATRRAVQIAYTTMSSNTSQLNLLNPNNQRTQLLVEGALSPTWSRNGIDLMFYSPTGIDGNSRGVWVHNIGQRKNVLVIPEPFSNPIAWSSNGIHVATSVTKEGRPNLVLWDVSTRNAYNGPLGEDPAWAPDGRRLAYRSCTEDGWNISAIEIIGHTFDLESLQPLTSGDDSQPSWSWDGQQIAFVRTEGANQDIYVMGSDGSNPTRLTDDPAIDSSPAWLPDGRLVFRSLREGQWGIYVMEADGAKSRRLLETPAEAEWQPDPLAASTNIRLIEPTPTPKPQPSVNIPAGQGVLVVSNVENNDEMTFTINNKEYKIPPHQYRTLPFPPGRYTWTASWPAKVSRTGIADIAVGQVSYPQVER